MIKNDRDLSKDELYKYAFIYNSEYYKNLYTRKYGEPEVIHVVHQNKPISPKIYKRKIVFKKMEPNSSNVPHILGDHETAQHTISNSPKTVEKIQIPCSPSFDVEPIVANSPKFIPLTISDLETVPKIKSKTVKKKEILQPSKKLSIDLFRKKNPTGIKIKDEIKYKKQKTGIPKIKYLIPYCEYDKVYTINGFNRLKSVEVKHEFETIDMLDFSKGPIDVYARCTEPVKGEEHFFNSWHDAKLLKHDPVEKKVQYYFIDNESVKINTDYSNIIFNELISIDSKLFSDIRSSNFSEKVYIGELGKQLYDIKILHPFTKNNIIVYIIELDMVTSLTSCDIYFRKLLNLM
ncbi:hypothetical protein RB653_009716 [Dictyostelium firmibasis]|uniref:Uncharacterized protein n=1 Tax=Dictyostelium firmibasis TaxID=79012 RepID=A0AAN7TJN3_9MYCE